jgi:peptide/nickel transport system substrate-binding protein
MRGGTVAPRCNDDLRMKGRIRSVLVLICALLGGGNIHAASPPNILVVVQSLDDITSLDPAEGFELSGIQAFTNLYQRLVQPDPDHPTMLVPTLATSWKSGATARSLIFELRPDATFSSGHRLRPEDVIFSLSRAVKLNGPPVFILNELGWSAENIDRSLVKVDDHHVQVTWYSDVGPAFALSILTAPVASIVDEREVTTHEPGADSRNGWLKTHSAGSGPFKIRRYIAHEALVLDANGSSPGDVPLLKTIVIKNVADAATRRLLVEVGDADIARDLGPDQIAALHGKPELKTLTFPSAIIHYLMFNTANPNNLALKNPALWEAARWLIDYDGIAQHLLKGEFEVHQAFLADGYPGALNDTPYHLDIAKAKAILQSAGLADIHIELDVFNQPPYGDIAQSLQASFAQAGIRLGIHPALTGEVYSRLRARAEEAAWLYWIPDYYDAHSTAGAFASNREDGTKTLAWRAGWAIPKLSAETQAAVEERDPSVRVQRYLDIQAEVQKSSPFVIALQAHSELIVRDTVKGYRQGLDADMVYYDRVSKQ